MSKSILNGNSKVWLMIIAMVVAAGIAWGEVRARTAAIDKKVDREVFVLHLEQSKRQFREIKDSLTLLNTKLDRMKNEK